MKHRICTDTNLNDARSFRVERAIGEILVKKYPGFKWIVDADVANNVAYITVAQLVSDRCYVIHLDQMDNDGKMVIRAGGEILERFYITRGKMRANEMATLKRDARGEHVYDNS